MKHYVPNLMSKSIRGLIGASLLLITLSVSAFGAPVVRQGSGANAAGLQSIVDQFRVDLGGSLNPNNGQSFINGRREIN